MKKSNVILFMLALTLIGATAAEMEFLRTHQQLGRPGVKWEAIPDSPRVKLYLPETVLDYHSVDVPTDTNLMLYLPRDSSFVTRNYMSPKYGFTMLRIVTMGTDRTTIHNPKFCLRGSGWDIDETESSFENIRIDKPYPYDLQVMKMISSREAPIGGKIQLVRGIYVFWFVADNDLTGDRWARMWRSATHLLRTGELERWSYVGCFNYCLPGHEKATFEQMKKFIAAAVPEFQLATGERAENTTGTEMATR